jgi:hypothetical protein
VAGEIRVIDPDMDLDLTPFERCVSHAFLRAGSLSPAKPVLWRGNALPFEAKCVLTATLSPQKWQASGKQQFPASGVIVVIS